MCAARRSPTPAQAGSVPLPGQSYRYLAYGSNLVSDGLARYIGEVTAADEATEVPGWHLRFQGRSTRWQGSPAIIMPDQTGRVKGRAWSLLHTQLISVVAGAAKDDDATAERAIDTLLTRHARLGPPSPATHRTATVHAAISQYDTVVVIAHPAGPLWAVTSSTTDVLRQRCEPYIAQVLRGLTQLLGPDRATDEMEAALARSNDLPPGPAITTPSHPPGGHIEQIADAAGVDLHP